LRLSRIEDYNFSGDQVKEIRDELYLNKIFLALEREDPNVWIPGYYGFAIAL
jgi:hypothetical protein